LGVELFVLRTLLLLLHIEVDQSVHELLLLILGLSSLWRLQSLLCHGFADLVLLALSLVGGGEVLSDWPLHACLEGC
jgi:hypothetical protein